MAGSGLVLCAVDLSDASEEALRQADRQARLFDGDLVVLHVLATTFPGTPMSPEGLQRIIEERDRLVREVGDRIIARTAAVTGRDPAGVAVLVEDGDPASAIVSKAEALGANLVVVSALGESGLPRLLLGSVAQSVVRHAHTSVLVARAGPAAGCVLAATDFSQTGKAAVDAAAEQARRRGAPLVLLHSLELLRPEMVVSEPAAVPMRLAEPPPAHELRRSVRRRLEEILVRAAVNGEVVVEDEPAADAIAGAADRLGAELVIVGTHGRTGLRRLLLGSVAEAVVRRAPCSVLVVRPDGRTALREK
jgi:nucleotide-binding universal stress UspA family protein